MEHQRATDFSANGGAVFVTLEGRNRQRHKVGGRFASPHRPFSRRHRHRIGAAEGRYRQRAARARPSHGGGLAHVLGREREADQRDLPDERLGWGCDVVHMGLRRWMGRRGEDGPLRPIRARPAPAPPRPRRGAHAVDWRGWRDGDARPLPLRPEGPGGGIGWEEYPTAEMPGVGPAGAARMHRSPSRDGRCDGPAGGVVGVGASPGKEEATGGANAPTGLLRREPLFLHVGSDGERVTLQTEKVVGLLCMVSPEAFNQRNCVRVPATRQVWTLPEALRNPRNSPLSGASAGLMPRKKYVLTAARQISRSVQ